MLQIEAWPTEAGRKEYEHAGGCAAVPECVAYYPNLDTKMAAWQLVAEPNAHMLGCQALNKFELSTNCTHAKNCDYNLGTESNVGCMACDDGCRPLAIDEARANMEPLSNGSLFIFFVLVRHKDEMRMTLCCFISAAICASSVSGIRYQLKRGCFAGDCWRVQRLPHGAGQLRHHGWI